MSKTRREKTGLILTSLSKDLFTSFAKIVLAMVSVDVFVCSPFLSSFHFPPISPSVLVFRLKLSHCLVKTNLKEQQFFERLNVFIFLKSLELNMSIVAASERE